MHAIQMTWKNYTLHVRYSLELYCNISFNLWAETTSQHQELCQYSY